MNAFGLPRLRWEIEEGEPRAVGGWEITPLVRKLSLSWRGGAGWGVSWAWARPVRIRVGREGRFQDVKVPDPTLKALALLGALALAGPVVYGIFHGVRRRRRAS